jgi:glycosyltransferase involved in cell wall biosynthesis
MKKQKVLFIITQSVIGGAQRHVLDLATHLPDGYEPVVAAGGAGALHKKLSDAGVRSMGIPSLTREIGASREFAALGALLSLIRTERPDILHLHSSKVGALGSLAGRVTGVRMVIFTVHGWALNEDRGALTKLFIGAAYALTFLFCHRIIAVSEAMAAYVRRFPFTARKMTVIRDAVEPIAFASDAEARALLLSKAKWQDAPLLIGTFAELHPVKGLHYALAALALLRKRGLSIKLVIAGEGTERKNLEMTAKEEGVRDSAALIGFLEDARRYARGLDIFILPSISEALSYSILEAGLAERPVVATRVGGIPEVIEDGVTGLLVPPRNAKALADAIERLAKDGELRTRLAAALKKKVAEEFSLAGMVSHTVALYERYSPTISRSASSR